MVVNIWSRANPKLADVALRIANYAIGKKIARAWDSVPSLMPGKRKKKRKRGSGVEDMGARLDKLFNSLRCNCAFLSCEMLGERL